MRDIKYQQILDEIKGRVEPLYGRGQVADYIPELRKVKPHQFAMCLTCVNDKAQYSTGCAEKPFSIQSISKVFALILAASKIGERVYQRVGIEPSGDPFNSLVQLEHEQGFPRNPLINAGALVVSDILISCLDDPKTQLLDFVRRLANNSKINFDASVTDSEKKTGFRNYAMAYFLKSFERIENCVDDVLDLYFHQCSLSMSCSDLSYAFLVLANRGVIMHSGDKILTPSQSKRINSIMQTCGFYDQAGEFTFRVGLPGKSGVGGGIAAIKPDEFSIAVWSPELNKHGNSVLGMHALEHFTTATGKSIF